MPTRLPIRRSLWRKLKPAPDTLRNLAATATEFCAALLFATLVVLLIARLDIGTDHVQFASFAMPLLGP